MCVRRAKFQEKDTEHVIKVTLFDRVAETVLCYVVDAAFSMEKTIIRHARGDSLSADFFFLL